MKLYEVPRNSRVRVVEPESGPPGARASKAGEIINFGHIDGMYSYCTDMNGNVIHLKAWTEVELA